MNADHRPEIDGLRALAVGAVIAHHFEPSVMPSGYLGVDIFFVISGYVIAASLYARASTNLGQLLAEFYTRRVKRLLPALLFVVLTTAFAISLFDPTPNTSIKTGLFSIAGASNIFLAHQAADYFGASTKLNPFTHTWSLGVEEQFYLLFPALVWWTAFRRGQH